MNPLGTRARSEELARALDGTAPVGSPVAPYAAVAGRLQSLGADLAAASAPRAEFRTALRTRLVAVASVQAVNAAATAEAPTRSRALDSAVSWSQSRRAQRGLSVAAGAMASVVAVAGVAVAGSQSLPGDPFYGVKRAGEAFELRTADGTVAKGTKQLQFAAERLREVRALAFGRDAASTGRIGPGAAPHALSSSASNHIREALADMDRETRTGSDLLTAAYRSTNSDAPLEILSHFASKQSRDLTALLPALPPAARNRGEKSLALVSGVAVDASQLLAVGICTGQCSPASAAPVLPPTNGGPQPQPAPSASAAAPCGCPTAPAPAPSRTPNPSPQPTPSATPEPTTEPTPTTSPRPTSSPSPSTLPTSLPSSVPTTPPTVLPTALPTILPTPLPLPVPLPTLPAAPALATLPLP